jgi:hypothetical protein
MVHQTRQQDSILLAERHCPLKACREWITRVLVAVLLSLPFLLLPGCQQQDDIRAYKVPKDTQAEKPPAVEGKVRLLAAILPHGGDTWFFKFVGPSAEVTANEATFDRFIQSVRFPEQGTEPISWAVPEGWQYEGPKQIRYATFRFGTKDNPLEVTVFKFGGQAGSTLENVNRWRRLDLGLEEIGPIQLSRYTKGIQVADIKGTLVDMSGPGATKTGMRP